MISADFVKKIEDLARPETVNIDGRTYATAALILVENPKQADMKTHTLTGIIDYLKANPDNISPESTILHIIDNNNVALVSTPDCIDKVRTQYISAIREPLAHIFGNKDRSPIWMDVETFIIALNSLFVSTDNIKSLLEFVSELTSESSESLTDNGVTQGVVKKKAISSARLERTTVPNPIALKPYRTFSEINQPESLFTFRLRSGGNGKPECALFEADGGAWKIQAIQNMRNWFEDKKCGVTILA